MPRVGPSVNIPNPLPTGTVKQQGGLQPQDQAGFRPLSMQQGKSAGAQMRTAVQQAKRRPTGSTLTTTETRVPIGTQGPVSEVRNPVPAGTGQTPVWNEVVTPEQMAAHQAAIQAAIQADPRWAAQNPGWAAQENQLAAQYGISRNADGSYSWATANTDPYSVYNTLVRQAAQSTANAQNTANAAGALYSGANAAMVARGQEAFNRNLYDAMNTYQGSMQNIAAQRNALYGTISADLMRTNPSLWQSPKPIQPPSATQHGPKESPGHAIHNGHGPKESPGHAIHNGRPGTPNPVHPTPLPRNPRPRWTLTTTEARPPVRRTPRPAIRMA